MTHQDVDVPPATRQALGALSLLSQKWQPVVLAVLTHQDTLGFNELLKAIPDISGKVLSDTLDALQDAGLVDRTVVSESPLRVEYELTAAGADIDGVFEELAAWSDAHLDTVTPTVLVAEEDRRITEMYSGWLSTRYTVLRAHDSEEIDSMLDEGLDVVLFAHRIPGVEPTRVPEVTPETCRTILLVDDRPDHDIVDIDCDDILQKPLVRERALDAVETQLSRQGESETEREIGALRAKKAALERAYSSETLAAREEYDELCSRLETFVDRIEN